MKSSFRFPAASVACAVALLLGPASIRAADDDQAPRRVQAEALLHAMRTDQVLAGATTRVDDAVDKFSQQLGAQGNLSPEQKEAMQKAQADAHITLHQQLSWDAVKSEFIQAYADAFTEDELKGLVAFYNSPLGQKLVDKQPAVTEKMGRFTQQKMMSVMPTLMQKIREAAGQKPPAAPALPASVTPAPPAVSPTH